MLQPFLYESEDLIHQNGGEALAVVSLPRFHCFSDASSSDKEHVDAHKAEYLYAPPLARSTSLMFTIVGQIARLSQGADISSP